MKHNERMKQNPNTQVDFLELISYSAGGYGLGSLAGTLPDIIEPATSPNHRKTFHSYGAMVAVTWGTIKLATDTDLSHEVKTAVTVAGASYLSHLALDSETPKGLPII
jgi:hypothetical protein